MKLVVRTVSTNSASSESMDISIRGAWNGGAFSVSAGGGFSQAL